MDMTRQPDARIHQIVVFGRGNSYQHTRNSEAFLNFLGVAELRGVVEACIFQFKMTFASSRFSFTYRYWRSFWSPEAASAE
jgi:hypothetical protein